MKKRDLNKLAYIWIPKREARLAVMKLLQSLGYKATFAGFAIKGIAMKKKAHHA